MKPQTETNLLILLHRNTSVRKLRRHSVMLYSFSIARAMRRRREGVGQRSRQQQHLAENRRGQYQLIGLAERTMILKEATVIRVVLVVVFPQLQSSARNK